MLPDRLCWWWYCLYWVTLAHHPALSGAVDPPGSCYHSQNVYLFLLLPLAQVSEVGGMCPVTLCCAIIFCWARYIEHLRSDSATSVHHINAMRYQEQYCADLFCLQDKQLWRWYIFLQNSPSPALWARAGKYLTSACVTCLKSKWYSKTSEKKLQHAQVPTVNIGLWKVWSYFVSLSYFFIQLWSWTSPF